MKALLRPGYGQALASARRAKGLSPADVAAKIKLTVRQVEALEAEDTDHLPGDLFLRGFVRNYARLVDLDADELIAPMDAQAAVSEVITAPSEGVALHSGGLKRLLLVPMLILVLFVLLVAALYQWLRQGEDTLLPQTAGGPATALAPQALPLTSDTHREQGETSPPVAQEGMPHVDPISPAPAPTAPAPANVTPQVSPPPAGERPGKPAVAEEASPAQESSKPGDAGLHVLRFQASRDAWIQVVDGNGKRFSKLIRAGGSDSISGVAPFKLVVGEAAQVRLTYDGHPIDLAPFIGQKVARLTLE
jgi:cytoskeleton protein RodZ